MDHKECSAVLDSLGARPWSSTAQASTCKRHGDLLAQRVLLQHDAGDQGYIVPLDSTTVNKTTKAPGTEYAVPDTEGGKPPAAVEQSSAQAPVTTRQDVTTTEESTRATPITNTKARTKVDQVTTVKPSTTKEEVAPPGPSTSREQPASPETHSSTAELTTLEPSTSAEEPTTSITSAKAIPEDFPVPSSADASVQTVHDITGKPMQIDMSSISDGSEPLMTTAHDGTKESSSEEDSSAGKSSGRETGSTAKPSSGADSAAVRSSVSDVHSLPSSESDSSDLAPYDSYIAVQQKFQLQERLRRQQVVNTAKSGLASAVAAVSLVAVLSALVLRSRWAERQYIRLDQPAFDSASAQLQLSATVLADIESAIE